MRRFLLSLLFVLGCALPAQAQLGSVPFVFTSGTVISSSEVNQNFATAYSNALNRTGGTMTGTLNVRDVLPVTDNTYDLGSAAFAFQDAFFDGVMTAVSAVISSTGASALDVGGGINAGTGNVGIVGTDGRIPAISSTYFASLSGANLTSIPESAITDGSILARYAEAAPFTGSSITWTSSSNQIALGHQTGTSGANLQINAASGQNGYITFTESGVASRWAIGASAGSSALDFRFPDISGTVATRWEGTGNMLHQFGVQFSNTISPSTLSAGNNNNYSPTGVGTAYLLRLTGDGGGTSAITGIAGGTSGRKLVLCATSTAAITLLDEDANSTAANRFADLSGLSIILGTGAGSIPCIEIIYDGTSSRWRVLGRVIG
jgi:hypothetical protein